MDCYNGDDDYLSLQDMIDHDMATDHGSDVFSRATECSASCGGVLGESHLPQQLPPPSSHRQLQQQVQQQHAQSGASAQACVTASVDLDSSVSNLSWLHAVNIGSLRQELDNASPGLLVNPQTVAPSHSTVSGTSAAPSAAAGLSSSPLRVIEVTLPNNVQITGSTVRYVTVSEAAAARAMYIAGRSSSGASAPDSPHKPPQLSQLHLQPPCSLPYQVQQRQQQQQQQHQQPQQHGQHVHAYYANCAPVPSSSVINNPYPKPAYSYSCLIAMALKNSKTGSLPVSEIYNFMTTNFPYFKTAPDGWKNSVRHNLSLNKCFEKIENPGSDGAGSRKGCLWSLNPAKARKMDEEIAKWNKKDPQAIKRSMAKPEVFDALERGHATFGTRIGNSSCDMLDTLGAGTPPNSIHAGDAANEPFSKRGQHNDIHQHCDIIPAEPLRTCADSASQMVHDDLAIDPVLADMNFQNSIWDDLTGDVIDFPFNGSPAEFAHANHTGSPHTSALSPESMARYHSAYVCKSSGVMSSTVPEGLGPRNIAPVARFVPATT